MNAEMGKMDNVFRLIFIALQICAISGLEVCINGTAVGYCSEGWHCCPKGFCCADGFICSSNKQCTYIRGAIFPGICATMCGLGFIFLCVREARRIYHTRMLKVEVKAPVSLNIEETQTLKSHCVYVETQTLIHIPC